MALCRIRLRRRQPVSGRSGQRQAAGDAHAGPTPGLVRDGFLTPRLPSGQIECVLVSSRCASFCTWVRPSAPAPRPQSPAGFAGTFSQQTQEGEMGEGPATVRVRYRKARRYAAIGAATVMGAGLAVAATVTGANAAPSSVSQTQTSSASSWITSGTATPIKHLVVIFQENVSFDHYFGTYPYAANTDGSHLPGQEGHQAGERPVQEDHQERPGRPAAHEQPQPLQPHAAYSLAGPHLRPEPRLHAGAEGRERREDGHVRPEHQHPRLHRDAHHPVRRTRAGDGLLRRQHRHGPVELRAELRDERKQLGHHLRAVHAGCAQPRSRARPAAATRSTRPRERSSPTRARSAR